MCEYQRIEENKPPICEYTKDFCTYCVLGNGIFVLFEKVGDNNAR